MEPSWRSSPGPLVGGGSVWYVLKARYEEISEQDICSAKQAFRAREEKLQREIDNLKERLESPDMDTEEPKTIQASAAKNREKATSTTMPRWSTVCSIPGLRCRSLLSMRWRRLRYLPDEFGEIEGYTQISLTYFDDGILSDENGVIIDEPEDIVGDALNHFGEYEKDSVFVRSDPKRCDYEILRDLRSYAEFRSTLPPKI